jgi:hypothetical protein
MGGALHTSRKTLVEVAVVLAVYILFLAVGVGSGQMTMTVDIVSPPDGASLRRSPVQLAARIAVRGVPLANVTMSFPVIFWEGGSWDFETISDADGIARFTVPVHTSGNYTWHATATKAGYPPITSHSSSFSIDLSLTVEGISPSTFLLAVSPVEFKARVTDMKDQLVESANVTFYVDATNIGSSMTAMNGIAKVSRPLESGIHTWFASATKDEEGGVSGPTMFLVGELASFQNEGSESLERNFSQLAHKQHSSSRESISDNLDASVLGSEFVCRSETSCGRDCARGTRAPRSSCGKPDRASFTLASQQG